MDAITGETGSDVAPAAARDHHMRELLREARVAARRPVAELLTALEDPGPPPAILRQLADDAGRACGALAGLAHLNR